MQNLNSSDFYNIGGGYLRLSEVDEFSQLNNIPFNGGVLHTVPTPLVHKEKKFPVSLALLD